MLLSIDITLSGRSLLHVEAESQFDSTGVEMGNMLRRLVFAATSGEVREPLFDQFLIATAADEWARRMMRFGRNGVATVPLSDGRPCTTIDHGPEHVPGLDPAEPLVVLRASTPVERDAA